MATVSKLEVNFNGTKYDLLEKIQNFVTKNPRLSLITALALSVITFLSTSLLGLAAMIAGGYILFTSRVRIYLAFQEYQKAKVNEFDATPEVKEQVRINVNNAIKINELGILPWWLLA
jgi:hypothetical protein